MTTLGNTGFYKQLAELMAERSPFRPSDEPVTRRIAQPMPNAGFIPPAILEKTLPDSALRCEWDGPHATPWADMPNNLAKQSVVYALCKTHNRRLECPCVVTLQELKMIGKAGTMSYVRDRASDAIDELVQRLEHGCKPIPQDILA